MRKFIIGFFAVLLSVCGALGGDASGSYRESEGEFKIAYALADRDAESGMVRILLAAEAPAERSDHHLDRLNAVCESVPGGCLIVEPTPDGEAFNMTLRLEELGYGGGGQYAAQIEVADDAVSGKIEAEVMQDGQLNVTFQSGFLPPRRAAGDLPADGGQPGAALLAQFEAIASGDRDAILASLTEEQRQQFADLSEEDQKQALADSGEFAPKNASVKGGTLYDGYAIVEFEAEVFGESAQGRALLSKDGDLWRVREVSVS